MEADCQASGQVCYVYGFMLLIFLILVVVTVCVFQLLTRTDSQASGQVYYVYGFMLLVFLILVVVTVCVTVVATYFLLNAENYRWHWTAFASAASASLYGPAADLMP